MKVGDIIRFTDDFKKKNPSFFGDPKELAPFHQYLTDTYKISLFLDSKNPVAVNTRNSVALDIFPEDCFEKI